MRSWSGNGVVRGELVVAAISRRRWTRGERSGMCLQLPTFSLVRMASTLFASALL
jgi:hypothetical protein